jgi:hypothetical protein
MKSTQSNPTSILATLASAFLLAASGHAAIIGINAPASSASINFDDTNSFIPGPVYGTLNSTVSSGPSWTGAPLFGTFPVAPITSDTANADLDAAFGGNTYAINFTNVLLNQGFLGSTGNGGFAQMHILFNVEFQLDGAGLPAQGTWYPNFTVSGTVQAGGGSFAFLGGVINYYETGNPTPIETVNYNWTNNIPGPFANIPVIGAPVNGFTPTLAPGTTLTLDGNFSFVVDPAIMYAESQMVPEPSMAMLALLSLPVLLARRRG